MNDNQTKRYQPTGSIKPSKLQPRKVTAKGTQYVVRQYGMTKENFLKLCKALKEYGMDGVKYVNFEVWEAVKTEPTEAADLTVPEIIEDDIPF